MLRIVLPTMLLAMLTVACGDDDWTYQPPGEQELPRETDRLLDRRYVEIPAGSGQIFAFNVRRSGQVAYRIRPRSTTSPDRFNSAIAPRSEWSAMDQNRTWSGYAVRNRVTSANESVRVPAGDYRLVIDCVNLIERCMVEVDLSVRH